MTVSKYPSREDFMWEFCAQANNANADMLEYIHTMVAHPVAKLGGVSAILSRSGLNELVLAVPKAEKPKIKGMLDIILGNVFCEQFKYKYLKKHTTLVGQDKTYYEAYLKVLTYFDAETDRKIVSKNLMYGNKINLESFFEFCLPTLKRKWAELVKITNENASVFLSSHTFLELLKFLISNIEPKHDLLTVSFGDRIYITAELSLRDLPETTSNEATPQRGEQKPGFSHTPSAAPPPLYLKGELIRGDNIVAEYALSDEAMLLVGLIELAPKEVVVESNPNCRKIIDLLCCLYGDRVRVV
ncbi:MAG: hypothetical protein FWE53_03955 [Firmicutes bacterium]|nr:hypothetical protein [Bacillota bacterium]